MRIFKTKWFARFARKEGITDEQLAAAVREMEQGLLEADYGGGLVKKRIARPGGGKSGGYRGILAYRSRARVVFMYGFAKNDKDNLDQTEETEYRRAAGIYLQLGAAEIEHALNNRVLEEVAYHDQKI